VLSWVSPSPSPRCYCSAMSEFNIINVEREIRNWIFGYLSVPSEHYGGNKPCPFAAKSWLEARVTVTIGGPEMVQQIISTWSDSYDLRIVAVDPKLSWPKIEEYCEAFNPGLVGRDLVLIPFVPDEMEPGDPAAEETEWGQVIDDIYPMIFVQRLSKVNEFSRLLEGRGYYDRTSERFKKYVADRRESEVKHARIKEDNGQKEKGQGAPSTDGPVQKSRRRKSKA
jgi:hypothetical protein